MPSEPRKLPAIAISTERLLALDDTHARLIVWPCADDDPLDTGPHGTTRYEPAVPRCKTCHPNFMEPIDVAFPTAFCALLRRAVRKDGSGYCSNHPEAKHG
jgi:hypothetical protein